MEVNNKVLGLDGKLYEENNYIPTVQLTEENPNMKTGMIMDGVTTQQGTSASTQSIEEAMPKLDEKTLKRLIEYQNKKPSVREYPKIRRNDKCPCGSGLKYKNCCLSSGKYEQLIKK